MKNRFPGFLIALSLLWGSATAQNQQRNQKDEQLYINHLRQVNAAVVPQFVSATNAMDEGKLLIADSLYSIVNAQVPDFDVVLRRLGSVRFEAGKLHEGLELARKAVALHDDAYNYLTLAYMYVQKSDSADINTAYNYLRKAVTLPHGNEADITILSTQVALQRNDLSDFISNVTVLQKNHPELMQTHYFAAIMYINQENWTEAETEIKKAEALGLSQEVVTELMDSGVNSHILTNRILIGLGSVTAIWALGMLILFLLGKYFSGLTLQTIEKGELETGSAHSGGKLREAYKKLISAGSFYYYISLPVVFILLVSITGGLIYISFALGHIPIKLLLMLLIATCTSIYYMIRTLLVKPEYTDPGRVLTPEEAPGMYELTSKVASQIGTRPIDEIRITAYNDMAVYENGTWKEKMNDEGKRILLVGTSVLNGFQIQGFKSVLAHEYGHFAHRDTAGGDIAFRVKRHIYNFIIALVRAEQNTVWNLSFHFLRLYYNIFCRISHGASRLQEVLADRLAAQTYGTVAFENGLTHVIRREMEFSKYANLEVEQAMEQKRAINNLYELSLETDENLETELQNVLNRATTEHDTHPSPADRFRYIAGITSPAVDEADLAPVSTLFTNWQALTLEMTETIEKTLNR